MPIKYRLRFVRSRLCRLAPVDFQSRPFEESIGGVIAGYEEQELIRKPERIKRKKWRSWETHSSIPDPWSLLEWQSYAEFKGGILRSDMESICLFPFRGLELSRFSWYTWANEPPRNDVYPGRRCWQRRWEDQTVSTRENHARGISSIPKDAIFPWFTPLIESWNYIF